MRLEVVIPYRDRQEHLAKQVPHLWKVLTDQGLDFRITVVEQEAGKKFNLGMMRNIGFLERPDADYYCFHDVDMYAEDVDYSYTDMPTHLAYACEQFGYKLPYRTYFGGVTLFDKASYEKINGHANWYWGWGAEDDDLYWRVTLVGFKRRFGRFWSEIHNRPGSKESQNENHKKYRANLESTEEKSGLHNCTYAVIKAEEYNSRLRTILVSI
jgi:beta-1,4-galactosyltransferase 2